MLIPYTREAIAQLRTLARNSTPRDAVIARFGWSPGMLERVCRDHGIAIAPPVLRGISDVPSSSLTHTAVIPLLPAEHLGQFIERLPPRQAHTMRVLRSASLASDGYIPASAISGTEASDSAARAVKRVIYALTEKLSGDRLPYCIDRRPNEGYRLRYNGPKS